jgi:hypothetical protein
VLWLQGLASPFFSFHFGGEESNETAVEEEKMQRRNGWKWRFRKIPDRVR